MNIRPYSPSDLDAMIAIFRSNIPKYFGPDEEPGLRDFLNKYYEHYFVCEQDSEILGAGGVALNDNDTISLCWGMIRSDHIGTGLGRRLTQFRIETARSNYGNAPIVIRTSQHTSGFYEKFGFRLLTLEKDGFGAGIDSCKMRLDS